MSKLRYFTIDQVKSHDCKANCWVILDGNVYDLSPHFIEANYERHLMNPILLSFAGKEVTKGLCGIKENMMPFYQKSGIKPWWERNDLVIGKISKCPVLISFINLLLLEDENISLKEASIIIEVSMESTLETIKKEYKWFNSHSIAYLWKTISKNGEVIQLDMSKTLQQNNIWFPPLPSKLLGLDGQHDLVTIFLYFEDDFQAAPSLSSQLGTKDSNHLQK